MKSQIYLSSYEKEIDSFNKNKEKVRKSYLFSTICFTLASLLIFSYFFFGIHFFKLNFYSYTAIFFLFCVLIIRQIDAYENFKNLEDKCKYSIHSLNKELNTAVVLIHENVDFSVCKIFFKNGVLHNEYGAAFESYYHNRNNIKESDSFYLYGRRVEPFNSPEEGKRLAQKIKNLSSFNSN